MRRLGIALLQSLLLVAAATLVMVTAPTPAGAAADIYVDARLNGVQADTAPGYTAAPGQTLSWTILVANIGDVVLTSVVVTDSQGLTVTCPKTSLAPGEAMTCTATGTAIGGSHQHIATATADAAGTPVSDDDSTWYSVDVYPAVDLETLVNGVDADAAPGLEILAGSPLLWSHVVTNTGDVALTSVAVTDDLGLAVACPKTSLAPGESMTCTAASTAVAGPHGLVGSVSADTVSGSVSDDDPAWYTGVTEGCPLGYWKKHTGAWPPTGYSTSQKVSSVFSASVTYPSVGDATLLRALAFKGGPSTVGAAQVLVRAGTAALLDAAHPDIDYPRTVSDVVTAVNTALASGDRAAMLAVAAQLDADNNGVCPLG